MLEHWTGHLYIYISLTFLGLTPKSLHLYIPFWIRRKPKKRAFLEIG